MTGTAVITGVNSTLGKHIASEFIAQGWRVYGSARDTDSPVAASGVQMMQLDLTDSDSIKRFAAQVLASGHEIDVLVNNAGHVLSGPFEGCSEQQVRRQFEVNFFGTIELTRQFLPHFKRRKSGTVVNISSLCGLTTFPMLSLYHASKWALEGFTESAMYELAPLGIRVKLIEPGGIKENEYSSTVEFADKVPKEYEELMHRVHKTNWFPDFSNPADVAKEVFRAATDGSNRLRYIIGNDSEMLLSQRSRGIRDESCFQHTRQLINGSDDE
jgi:NAD(P)-dependent dehydrogenase (short-subunit alcohol dehydrogenase family)